jgi:hypothetical protein
VSVVSCVTHMSTDAGDNAPPEEILAAIREAAA